VHYHLRELAQHVKNGIASRRTPLESHDLISDGITMGTEGSVLP